jgi:hypothetical protein
MTLEPIEVLNKRLADLFGLYPDGRAKWRIVFSEDEFEKRLGDFEDVTREGIYLRSITEVRLVPKYRKWINPPCYILERLLEVPSSVETDLIEKTSYEPVWTFRDINNNPLPPIWRGIELVIHQVYENAARRLGVKYKDPRAEMRNPKIAIEAQRKEIDDKARELFGNETDVGDALAYKSGIVVPANYIGE